MPRSRLIVLFYGAILAMDLWLILLSAIIGGSQANGFIGAVDGLIVSALIASVFVGAFLVLITTSRRMREGRMTSGI